MGKTKMKKYKCMVGSKKLASHVPETRWLTRSNMWDLIAKYGQVILKPLGGSRGYGVIKVSAIDINKFEVHHESNKVILEGKDQTYHYIEEKVGEDTYIVQRRIHLAKINDRPFDMRIVVQRKPHSKKWKVTGKIAKVAGRGYIVTNISRSKGTLLPLETAIKKASIIGISRKTLLAGIQKNAIRTAKRLRKIYPHQRIYGMDIGVDRNGRIWIIEANRKPLLSHFKKIKNKTMYRRILKYNTRK